MNKCVITIARGYGSGGKQIGKKLAQKLNIDCYDREILRMASDVSGISEELFAKADETTKKTVLYNAVKKIYNGGLIPPESNDFTSDENLFNYQAKIINELYEESSCVIIGRCADFVLKDKPNVVKVFLYSNLEQSLKNVYEVQGLEEKEAREKIEISDKYRADYYKKHTGNEWNDVKNYDLCINTDNLTFDQGVLLIQEYMKIKGLL